MRYIINLTITFDPDSRLLMLRNNDQHTIVLSKPATRLLIELIKNNKNELTRETLIKHVWEDYGFSPSSATLSNHISELRKAFEALGGSKDILITVPRIGFKMEAEIHPETKQQKENASAGMIDPLSPESEPVRQASVNPDCIPSVVGTMRGLLKPVLVLILTFLAIISVMRLLILNRDEEPLLVSIQDKCNVYLLGDYEQNDEQTAHALKMAANEKIDCSQFNRDIYYMEARPDNDILKVYFMAVCTKNTDMSYKNCHNYRLIE